MRMSKWMAIALSLALAIGLLAGCSGEEKVSKEHKKYIKEAETAVESWDRDDRYSPDFMELKVVSVENGSFSTPDTKEQFVRIQGVDKTDKRVYFDLACVFDGKTQKLLAAEAVAASYITEFYLLPTGGVDRIFYLGDSTHQNISSVYCKLWKLEGNELVEQSMPEFPQTDLNVPQDVDIEMTRKQELVVLVEPFKAATSKTGSGTYTRYVWNGLTGQFEPATS